MSNTCSIRMLNLPVGTHEMYGAFSPDRSRLLTGGDAPKPEPEPRAPRITSLAPLEAELAHHLMQEGVVVRAHDIARVVGFMAGVDVDWEAEETR